MAVSIADLESQLNDFDAGKRASALDELLRQVQSGACDCEAQGDHFNLHAHSFYSFNGYGYSPSYLAWAGRKRGLCAMGLVDFDVLDGVDEFLAACRRVGLRAVASLETRVFVPEFADRVINSPGEPGIAYHMGVGFVSGAVADRTLLDRFKSIAGGRTRELVQRVNPYLAPAALDFERDVLPRTPQGNATERHVCAAYDEKAREVFPDKAARIAFWAEKLGMSAESLAACIDDAPTLQGHIRAKTMKAGGVGYVQPNGPDFPSAAEVNAFSKAQGAIPTLAWLDGTTAGEQCLDELLDVMISQGVAAVNIIPDRNWNLKNADEAAKKVKLLNEFVAAVQARDLPIIVGTEMNAYGQPFVDNFDAAPMRPHHAAFLAGANIVHAHTLLQARAGMGYVSDWAGSHFADAKAKNDFFRTLGERVGPGSEGKLDGISASNTPQEILSRLG